MKSILEKIADDVTDSDTSPVKGSAGIKEDTDEDGQQVEMPPESQPTGEITGQTVMEFLKNNPFPTFDQLESYCQQGGLDIATMMTSVLALATLMVQFLSQGKLVESGMTYDQLDQQQLQAGEQVEAEHCSIPQLQRKIAGDHLAEHPEYYTYIEQAEQVMDEEEQGKQSTDAGAQVPINVGGPNQPNQNPAGEPIVAQPTTSTQSDGQSAGLTQQS